MSNQNAKSVGGLRKPKTIKTKTELCSKAYLILKHTHESSQALLTAYKLARFVRGVKTDKDGKAVSLTIRGMSTDEEQDLLRAMLVTAASGLDSMTKQLIRDVLPKLLEINEDALTGLETFLRRKIRGEIEDEAYEGTAFLAKLLISPSIQKRTIEEYILFLTKGSLQSPRELSKVTASLGLSPQDIKIEQKTLKPIFEARNKIIHELDINFEAPRRNRNVRREATMKSYTNTLLTLAEKLLTAVDNKIQTVT